MAHLLDCELAAPVEIDAIVDMLKSARLAPSGHNTQPWKFKVNKNIIRIFADYSRRVPVVDPDDRELFISLGCALENLVIAARVKGYAFNVQLFPSGGKDEAIRVTLEKGMPKHDPLYQAIAKRQSNRKVYSGKVIPENELDRIKRIAPYNKVRVDIFPKSKEYETLAELVMEGNTIQMDDEPFKTELISWIRFNAHEKKERGDGICHDAMGFPALPGFIGSRLIRRFLKPDKQNKADGRKLASSAALVLFSTTEYSPAAWVNLGRTFQRLALLTTHMGIAHAHMNQPIEVKGLNQKLATSLGLNGYYPSLIIRLGYADPMPRSPRRSVEEVLVVNY